MLNNTKLYRTAYVTQNTGHDFQELLKVCDRLHFISNGYEPENEMLDTLVNGLKGFDPEKDLVVPVGNVTSNLLMGLLLTSLCRFDEALTIAIFYEKEYHFKVIKLESVFRSLPDATDRLIKVLGTLGEGKSNG